MYNRSIAYWPYTTVCCALPGLTCCKWCYSLCDKYLVSYPSSSERAFSVSLHGSQPEAHGLLLLQKMSKTSCKYFLFFPKRSVISSDVWSLYFLSNVTRTVNRAFVGNRFRWLINPYLVPQWVFGAAAWCMWDWVKINYSACVHANEGTCRPV